MTEEIVQPIEPEINTLPETSPLPLVTWDEDMENPCVVHLSVLFGTSYCVMSFDLTKERCIELLRQLNIVSGQALQAGLTLNS